MKKIPKFKSIDEELDFWSKHGILEFMDVGEEVQIDASQAGQRRDEILRAAPRKAGAQDASPSGNLRPGHPGGSSRPTCERTSATGYSVTPTLLRLVHPPRKLLISLAAWSSANAQEAVNIRLGEGNATWT